MLPGKHHLITAKATGFIFSLFDIALTQEVPFSILQYIQYVTSTRLSVLFTVKSDSLVVPHDGLFYITKLSVFFVAAMLIKNNGNCLGTPDNYYYHFNFKKLRNCHSI